jgi:alanyl-tRNA synthetase
LDKKEILKEFSSDPDRYYKVELFEQQGFVRKSCSKCGRFFWTLNGDRNLCPDDGLDTYSFIGEPPTSKRFDYTQSWKQVEEFFVKTSVSRYPVVCRWRDDLYFTIASVVDFQRVMGSKVVFEFPANPLVVPQTCLRFKDLENVGVTGRHFSSFCMIGQHSIPNSEGYWKDQCVDLDYRLLTDQFGIKKDEVVFVEDVWAGGGSFGPSLEYFVRGLELGNAVFTEFQGELGQHTTLDQRVIDMGAGLERFAWITMGTPTAYDCCFGPINEKLFGVIGIDSDSEILRKYFTEIAKEIDHYDDLNEVRRLAIRNAGISEDQLNKLIDTHIDYLKNTYPELDEKREDVKVILKLESQRYEDSKVHMKKKADKIREKGTPTVDELITFYRDPLIILLQTFGFASIR